MPADQIQIRTERREELIDITAEVQAVVRRSGIKEGLAIVFTPHTTAAVTINEKADPAVKTDIIYKLSKEIPQNDDYQHAEGNSDAHVKASLLGASVPVIIADGQLVLGTWQAILFGEFDGPRSRKIIIKIVSG